jgi:DNA primase
MITDNPREFTDEGNGFRRLLNAVKEQVPVARLANDLGSELRETGKGMRGLCPIHGGRNRQSFAVYGERWHCFRCNESGDVLHLYVKARGYYDVKAALIDLAGTYGIEAPPRSEQWRKWQAEKSRRHDELTRWRERRYQRRMYRWFSARGIAAIEDDAERESEARKEWAEAGALARAWAVRSVG